MRILERRRVGDGVRIEDDDVRPVAGAEEAAILTRYREEATALLERERALTESQVKSTGVPLEAEAARLAESVVRRILGRAA